MDQLLLKLENVCKIWYNRTLSWMGKVLVINTLMASLFVYRMTVLSGPTPKEMVRIHKILHEFFWKKQGRAKIPLRVLQNRKEIGGLKLVHFGYRQRALQIQWIRKVINPSVPNDFQRYIPMWLIPALGDMLWYTNLRKKDVHKFIKKDSFWKEIYLTWTEQYFRPIQSFKGCEIVNEVLWCNSCIRICNEPILWEGAIKAGVYYVRDLLDEDCENFLSHTEIEEKFPDAFTWLEHRQIISAIPIYWKSLLAHDFTDTGRLLVNDFCEGQKKVVAKIYSYYISIDENEHLLPYYNRYREKVDELATYLEYKLLFNRLYKCVKDTKLRNFQYRLLLGKVFTNTMLCKWKIKMSMSCDFCEDIQTVKHLFWECPKVRPLWAYINTFVPSKQLTYSEIIGNTIEAKACEIVNIIALITKYFIFRHKCQEKIPTVAGLKMEIAMYEKILRKIAFIENRKTKHTQKWEEILMSVYNKRYV